MVLFNVSEVKEGESSDVELLLSPERASPCGRSIKAVFVFAVLGLVLLAVAFGAAFRGSVGAHLQSYAADGSIIKDGQPCDEPPCPCPEGTEYFGGLCYVSCSTLTNKTKPYRTAYNICCAVDEKPCPNCIWTDDDCPTCKPALALSNYYNCGKRGEPGCDCLPPFSPCHYDEDKYYAPF